MKDTTWKKISQKVLLKHSRISVYEDSVRLPNGHQTEYIHFGENKGGAMVIVKRDDGKILLQREYSYPPNCWLYQFPGGAVEGLEEPEEAAKRELAEEASLSGTLNPLGFFYLNNRRSKNKMFVYLATSPSPAEARKDIEEEIETYWFNEDDIRQMISSGEIVNQTVLAGWALYTTRELKSQ